MKGDKLEVIHDTMSDTVIVKLNGAEVKTYDADGIMTEFGLDDIMTDVDDFVDKNEIELREDVGIVFIRR